MHAPGVPIASPDGPISMAAHHTPTTPTYPTGLEGNPAYTERNPSGAWGARAGSGRVELFPRLRPPYAPLLFLLDIIFAPAFCPSFCLSRTLYFPCRLCFQSYCRGDSVHYVVLTHNHTIHTLADNHAALHPLPPPPTSFLHILM